MCDKLKRVEAEALMLVAANNDRPLTDSDDSEEMRLEADRAKIRHDAKRHLALPICSI